MPARHPEVHWAAAVLRGRPTLPVLTGPQDRGRADLGSSGGPGEKAGPEAAGPRASLGFLSLPRVDRRAARTPAPARALSSRPL